MSLSGMNPDPVLMAITLQLNLYAAETSSATLLKEKCVCFLLFISSLRKSEVMVYHE